MKKPSLTNVQQLLRPDAPLVTMGEDTSVAAAARTMSEKNIGSTLVLDAEGRFKGIVTERDILRKVAACKTDACAIRLGEIATTEVLHCTLDTSISTVEEMMHWHRIRHIPVFESGQPVAILSSRDILAYQIVRSREMKVAAEQIARMSIELKSSDIDELVNWIVSEVAKVFSASRVVLWLEPDENDADFGGFVARSGCRCRDADISAQIDASLSASGPCFVSISEDAACRDNGLCSRAMLIPLTISGCGQSAVYNVRKRRGFLCICGINADVAEADEVTFYKAGLLGEILSVSLTNARLYREYQLARNESRTDPLTGLGTRRVLETELENEYTRAKRYGRSFCLAVMDIDRFKTINDNEGHAAGDEALRRLAATITSIKRSPDVAVRYGGDEMVILMPETSQEQALNMVERLRTAVEEESLYCDPAITISCGLAQWSPGRDESPREVFLRADNALYEAKRSGRNCVCVSDPAMTLA